MLEDRTMSKLSHKQLINQKIDLTIHVISKTRKLCLRIRRHEKKLTF